jgi:hypothetical protein
MERRESSSVSRVSCSRLEHQHTEFSANLDLFSCLADASYHASEAAFPFFVVAEPLLLNYCACEAFPATFITSFFPYSLKYV